MVIEGIIGLLMFGVKGEILRVGLAKAESSLPSMCAYS